jgi:hypothetical protein
VWFRFPKGSDRVTVECQPFVVEALDDEGNAYFRAPDHFSTRILAISGFALVEKPPEGAPPDLPRADPLRDGAISELTKSTEALKAQVQHLTSDLAAANAALRAAAVEKAQLGTKLQEAAANIAALEEEIEAVSVAPQAVPVPVVRK